MSTKDVIVCLVGHSGSGKSTVAKLLSKDFNYIDSYTTRAQRYPGEGGHIYVNVRDYLFMPNSNGTMNVLKYDRTDKEFGRLYKPVNNIAYTYFDKAHYWAQRDQYKDKGISIYIIDPDGVTELEKIIKDAIIVTIYLEASESIRYKRMSDEDRKEIGKRIANDKIKFAEVEYDFAVNAEQDIDKVYKDVLDLINII